MSNPTTIKIDNTEYVRSDQVSMAPTVKQIVVLQRGWVAIGDISQEGTTVIIKNCSIIRKWGTTTGLGEIAMGGPTPNTILDNCPTIRTHELGVVFYMDVDESKWN